jgi:hypothetical protein
MLHGGTEGWAAQDTPGIAQAPAVKGLGANMAIDYPSEIESMDTAVALTSGCV